ncbi:uncharacterized protein SCHCODRAFT_02665386 [Schizophyllum commune H4-8]|uniref:Expressed protein n=1 Tax=Schizophyllum commune (strain H4-8 / FGSC 9210) TaxID=578458 RepID=D8Q3P0_SCHCM|nr:uncharacterized protein SCHCODRAFT_02665386 [Schizophyllum commune H4-8]KAI5894984.1 hypothetical protein SCHCODRAFT_02665386 [Schizophyllum commune H4-8]
MSHQAAHRPVLDHTTQVLGRKRTPARPALGPHAPGRVVLHIFLFVGAGVTPPHSCGAQGRVGIAHRAVRRR